MIPGAPSQAERLIDNNKVGFQTHDNYLMKQNADIIRSTEMKGE